MYTYNLFSLSFNYTIVFVFIYLVLALKTLLNQWGKIKKKQLIQQLS